MDLLVALDPWLDSAVLRLNHAYLNLFNDLSRTRLSEDYERITSDLQYRTETYQKAVNRRRNELFQKMGPGVQAALDDLVKLEAYDLVLPRNTVIYVNPKHDITRKVTEVLDKQS